MGEDELEKIYEDSTFAKFISFPVFLVGLYLIGKGINGIYLGEINHNITGEILTGGYAIFVSLFNIVLGGFILLYSGVILFKFIIEIQNIKQ